VRLKLEENFWGSIGFEDRIKTLIKVVQVRGEMIWDNNKSSIARGESKGIIKE
jgi:hypothetical protein